MLGKGEGFFRSCGYCDTEGLLADATQEVAVDFGMAVNSAAYHLKHNLPVDDEMIDYEARRACKLSGLPAEETEDLFKRCLEVRADGRCNQRVETSREVEVDKQYL